MVIILGIVRIIDRRDIVPRNGEGRSVKCNIDGRSIRTILNIPAEDLAIFSAKNSLPREQPRRQQSDHKLA